MDTTERARRAAESEYGPEPKMGERRFATMGDWHNAWTKWKNEREGYAHATSKHLPLHQKSMEYLRRAPHLEGCAYGTLYEDQGQRMCSRCSCGLDAHLSTLKALTDPPTTTER